MHYLPPIAQAAQQHNVCCHVAQNVLHSLASASRLAWGPAQTMLHVTRQDACSATTGKYHNSPTRGGLAVPGTGSVRGGVRAIRQALPARRATEGRDGGVPYPTQQIEAGKKHSYRPPARDIKAPLASRLTAPTLDHLAAKSALQAHSRLCQAMAMSRVAPTGDFVQCADSLQHTQLARSHASEA